MAHNFFLPKQENCVWKTKVTKTQRQPIAQKQDSGQKEKALGCNNYMFKDVTD